MKNKETINQQKWSAMKITGGRSKQYWYRLSPARRCSLFFQLLLSIIMLFFLNSTASATFGTPHIIYGNVLDADGLPSDKSNIDIYAYIPERPQEILDKYSVGCGYGLDSLSQGWLWFEAGNFASIWRAGEKARIIIVDPILNETGFADLVLDTSGSQIIPEMNFAYGDIVGPIALNAQVDGTVHAFIPEGTTNVTLTATIDDSISGNSNIQSAEYFVDTDPGNGFGTAMEPLDGIYDNPSEQVIASVNSSSWVNGSRHTIYIRGQDALGNWGTTHLVTVEITPASYQFMGFLPPITNDGSSVFKLGRTVPVKFQLKDGNGNFGYNGKGWLTLQQYIGDEPAGLPIPATSSGDSNNGNEFRYDGYDKLYIYNLDTKQLSAGKWKLIVTMENGRIFEIFIELR
ncbi:MAG: PxKF domain-containing protein [Nitrospirae bacterium]|nr:PxKF domain-containing protein [Nitrospirota bacterium]